MEYNCPIMDDTQLDGGRGTVGQDGGYMKQLSVGGKSCTKCGKGALV
jgi:hypothetical protein